MENNKVKQVLSDMFGEVRTINKDGELWFVATDVAKYLGDRDANKIIRVLDDEDKDTHIASTLEGNQELSCIFESRLYSAVL
jgi:prophage antirepressor-like protein